MDDRNRSNFSRSPLYPPTLDFLHAKLPFKKNVLRLYEFINLLSFEINAAKEK